MKFTPGSVFALVPAVIWLSDGVKGLTVNSVSAMSNPSSFPTRSAAPTASTMPSGLNSSTFVPSMDQSKSSSSLPSTSEGSNSTAATSEFPSLKQTSHPSFRATSNPSEQASSNNPTVSKAATMRPTNQMAASPTNHPSVTPTWKPTSLELLLAPSSSNSSSSYPTSFEDLLNGTASSGPAECSAYPACSGLVSNCCPTIDDVFLYCCFEAQNVSTYKKDLTLVGMSSGARSTPPAEYFVSTSTYFDPARAPNGDFPVIEYIRNASEVYDLIYYKTSAISNASDYVSGNKKFYMDLWSTAPTCTEVLLQLDNLELAKPDNYPIGRHSRYIAWTTKQNQWERLQFDFLDRPDPSVGSNTIDAMPLFFSPGLKLGGTYYFRNLDIASEGCTSNCETSSPKSCPALYSGEAGFCKDGIDNDHDGLVDCADPDCSSDPACTTSMSMTYASAVSQREALSGGASLRSELPWMGLILSLGLGVKWTLQAFLS